MTANQFSKALGNISETYIDEAIRYSAPKKTAPLLKWVSVAACLCLVAGGMAAVLLKEAPVENVSKNSDVSHPHVESGPAIYDPGYTLTYGDSGFVMIFDDPNAYRVEHSVPGSVGFDSMEEFVNTVTNGCLTEGQKQIIATAFPKDDTGAVLICDFDNLYVPTLPGKGVVDGVSWAGQTYSFGLTLEDGVFGSLHCLTEAQFQSRYQREYADFFDRDTITVTSTKTFADGKTAIYYTTRSGEFMNLRYTLTAGEQTITVDKTYRLQTNNPQLPTSSTVPSGIELYGTSDEGFFCITLFGFAADPADEWILRFGLERYTGK